VQVFVVNTTDLAQATVVQLATAGFTLAKRVVINVVGAASTTVSLANMRVDTGVVAPNQLLWSICGPTNVALQSIDVPGTSSFLCSIGSPATGTDYESAARWCCCRSAVGAVVGGVGDERERARQHRGQHAARRGCDHLLALSRCPHLILRRNCSAEDII
jgi:hypothetical protein